MIRAFHAISVLCLTIHITQCHPGGDEGQEATLDTDDLGRMVRANIEDVISEVMQNYTDLKQEIEVLRNELRDRRTIGCSQVDPNSYRSGNETRGMFEIYVPAHKVEASCDLSTDGGRWTVIQRRMDGSVDFFRNHTDYVNGFGDAAGEFWIGLENLHIILQSGDNFQLRIDMEDWEGTKKFAQYSRFDIGGAREDYILDVSGYSGTATDSMNAHNKGKFSTRDHDVDTNSGNCALLYKGGWWYTACHHANLNGHYYNGGVHESYADGINWRSWKGYHYSLKFVEMKIRPSN